MYVKYGTGPRSPEQQEVDTIFALMDAAIRTHTYEPFELFGMVGDLIESNAILAQSIAKHVGNVLLEWDTLSRSTDDKYTVTDIVVESYRRALFDFEESPKYGTPFLLKDIGRMRQFVQEYIENQTMGSNTMPGEAAVQPRQ